MNKMHQKLLKSSQVYASWHQRPEHKFFHWLVFVLIVGFTFTALVTKIDVEFSRSIAQLTEPQTEKAQAAEVKTLTTQLLQAVKKYQSAPASQKPAILSELTQTVQKRREALLREAISNPENFLLNALPPGIFQQLPSEIHPLLEREQKIRGTLIVSIIDDFNNQKSQTRYELESAGARYTLHFAKSPPGLLSGSVVIARGSALDQEMVLASGGGESLEVVTAAAAGSTGEQRTLAILFNFTNNTNQPFTTSYASDLLFYATGHDANTGSVNTYYQDNSFGQTSFSGDVVGWYTIPYDNSNCGTMYTTWASAAEQAAKNAGVNVDSYPRRVYVFPIQPLSSCAWAGYGTYGGSPSKAWIVAENITRHPYGVELLGHELGHNLGARHASSIKCGTKQIDIYANCTISEYGDTSDIMGSWNPGHFNGPHKIGETWFGSSQVQTITANDTYNISLLEQGEASVKVLKISKPDTGEAYYLSYRQPLGFDAGISTGYHRGASIHIWNGTISDRTKIVDTTPETSAVTDSPLGDGLSFQDTINGITVTQLGHDSSKATLSVSFGPAVCTKANPTVSVSPLSQSGSAGQTLSYAVTVKNNDASACASTTFNLSGVLPSGWANTFSQSSLTLAPGANGSATWQVTSSSSAPDGSYTITAKATDSADSTHAGSVSATYVVFTPVPDTTPPTVSIIGPADGSTLKTSTKINISASDNVGVVKVELYIDGILKKTFTAPPYTYNWNTKKIAAGSYTITAKAYDAAGNIGSASITVYK